MKTKKFLAMLMFVAVSVGSLAGCGAKQEVAPVAEAKPEEAKKEEAPVAQEPVTIKVSAWSDCMRALVESGLVADFETQNPDIKVEIIEYPAQEYQDKLVVQLAGGADLDVILMKNTADYSNIAAKNQLVDMTELVKRDKVDVSNMGPLFEGVQYEGKQYALPYSKTSWILYYNKDLFDAAGVEYPSDDMTWNDFRETAKKVSSGSGNDKVWGAYLHTWPQVWYGMGLQTGASIIDQDLTPFKESLQFRMDLEADGTVMPYVEAKATNAHYKTEFAKGQTAMNVIGAFHIGQLRELEDAGEMNFDWDIAPMPHPEGVAANTTWGMASPVGININSKNQEAAWKFVNFMTSIEGAKHFAKVGEMPANVNEEVLEIYKGDGSRRPANIDVVGEAKVYLENPTIPNANIAKDEIFGKESELTFIGERSAEDTFKVIEERIKNEVNQ